MSTCPRCGAKRDEPCTYTAPRSPYYTEEQLRTWPSMQAQFERIGQPTKRWHEERLRLVGRQVKRRSTQERRERDLAAAERARRRHPALAIRHAEAEWDRRERQQLVTWLARYADVLTTTNDERTRT